MRLCNFEVTEIGPVFRDMKPAFSRCHATLGLADEGSESVSQISFNVVYRGSGDETIDTVKANVLVECIRLMTEGVNLLKGKSIQTLYELTDKERERSLTALSSS